jgi:hypothetical protein
MISPGNFWRAWLLGGLDGLAVGILGAATSVIIFEHDNTQTLDAILNQTYLTETPSLVPVGALVWLSVMIIVSCCVCFSFSSYLIHRLLSRRISSLYFLWQIIGLIAAVVWCGAVAIIDGTEYRRGRGSILRYDALLTRDFFVTAFLLFVALMLLNFAYAFLLRLALGQYAGIQQTDTTVAPAV